MSCWLPLARKKAYIYIYVRFGCSKGPPVPFTAFTLAADRHKPRALPGAPTTLVLYRSWAGLYHLGFSSSTTSILVILVLVYFHIEPLDLAPFESQLDKPGLVAAVKSAHYFWVDIAPHESDFVLVIDISLVLIPFDAIDLVCIHCLHLLLWWELLRQRREGVHVVAELRPDSIGICIVLD